MVNLWRREYKILHLSLRIHNPWYIKTFKISPLFQYFTAFQIYVHLSMYTSKTDCKDIENRNNLHNSWKELIIIFIYTLDSTPTNSHVTFMSSWQLRDVLFIIYVLCFLIWLLDYLHDGLNVYVCVCVHRHTMVCLHAWVHLYTCGQCVRGWKSKNTLERKSYQKGSAILLSGNLAAEGKENKWDLLMGLFDSSLCPFSVLLHTEAARK